MSLKVPISFLSVKVIYFLSSDSFQPENLYSTERVFLLNLGYPCLGKSLHLGKPQDRVFRFFPFI